MEPLRIHLAPSPLFKSPSSPSLLSHSLSNHNHHCNEDCCCNRRIRLHSLMDHQAPPQPWLQCQGIRSLSRWERILLFWSILCCEFCWFEFARCLINCRFCWILIGRWSEEDAAFAGAWWGEGEVDVGESRSDGGRIVWCFGWGLWWCVSYGFSVFPWNWESTGLFAFFAAFCVDGVFLLLFVYAANLVVVLECV